MAKRVSGYFEGLQFAQSQPSGLRFRIVQENPVGHVGDLLVVGQLPQTDGVFHHKWPQCQSICFKCWLPLPAPADATPTAFVPSFPHTLNGEADDAQAHAAQIRGRCGFHPGRTPLWVPMNLLTAQTAEDGAQMLFQHRPDEVLCLTYRLAQMAAKMMMTITNPNRLIMSIV